VVDRYRDIYFSIFYFINGGIAHPDVQKMVGSKVAR
jgi:hypothetical protein